jgi:hypothetical protein
MQLSASRVAFLDDSVPGPSSVAVEELAVLNGVGNAGHLFKPQQRRPYRDAVARPIQFPPDLLYGRDTPASHGEQDAMLEVSQFRRVS